jgi:hypothetical protein
MESGQVTARRKVQESRTLLEGAIGEGENPVGETCTARCYVIVSTAGHAKSGGKQGCPQPKAKYLMRPIVNQYREGTVKSTPTRGVKETLKPCASGRSEPLYGVTACLL